MRPAEPWYVPAARHPWEGAASPERQREFERDVGAAAIWSLVFVALLTGLQFAQPPSGEQLAASDPLTQLVADFPGLWSLPLLCALPALAWWRLAPPDRPAHRRALRGLGAAVAVAAIGLPLIRLVVGSSLPSFIPPEESSRPGMTLGVGAGLLEEAVFRLALLPAAYGVFRRFWKHAAAAAGAVILSSFAFALAHELGPGAGPFEARFFASRFFVPGCVLGALVFRVGPSFVVSLHATAHVGIALLFTGE